MTARNANLPNATALVRHFIEMPALLSQTRAFHFMITYTCKDFTGHWPVGVAAVVCADNEDEAAARLNRALRELGLPGDAIPANMIEFPHPGEEVRVMAEGEY